MKSNLHEKLGITFAELGALLGTRNMLAAGVLEHMEDRDDARAIARKTGRHLFNMGVSCDGLGCGSAACIGGTMALIMGYTVYEAKLYVAGDPLDKGQRSYALRPLFHPQFEAATQYETITVEEAVVAIDRFCDQQEPYWKHTVERQRRDEDRTA